MKKKKQHMSAEVGMEPLQKKKKRMIQQQQQEDGDVPPELIEIIQLKLPSKDAASTCILSKSWLHAWSTTHSIRFSPTISLAKNNSRNHMRWFYLRLLRYRRHDLPITSLDLQLGIHSAHEHPFQNLIKLAVRTSSSSLKRLRLSISALSFDLPDDVFYIQSLHTLSLHRINPFFEEEHRRAVYLPPVIRSCCTNLRVLDLFHVRFTPDAFYQLLSNNKFLETISLGLTPFWGFEHIVISNLPYLRDFRLRLGWRGWIHSLEIHDTPSLRSLEFYAPMLFIWKTPPTSSFEIATVRSLTKLQLHNVYMDDAFSHMINSSFPFLEDLTLSIKSSSVDIFYITCITLQRLMLYFPPADQIKLQVYAPNLLIYRHNGSPAVPLLFFATAPPEQIHLTFYLGSSIDESFFIYMREALKLPTKFNIAIRGFRFAVSDHRPFNVDHVKAFVPPHPATNVEQLLLKGHTENDEDNSLLLDAVFSVCHPLYAKTSDGLRLKVANYLLNLILKGGVMENCEIRDPLLDGRWVALTSSSLTLLDATTPDGFYEFKLSWRSP